MIVFAMSSSAFAEKVTVLLGMRVDCSGVSGHIASPHFLNYFLESLSSLWHAILIWGAKHCLVCCFIVPDSMCVCVNEMCSKVRCKAAVLCRACRRVCTGLCGFAFTHGRSYCYLNSTRGSNTCAGQMPTDS